MQTTRVVIEVEVQGECTGTLLESVLALPHVMSVVELERDFMGGYEPHESTRIVVTWQ